MVDLTESYEAFNRNIEDLIAQLPTMAAGSYERAVKNVRENPSPELRKLQDEVKTLKMINGIFEK